MTGRCITIGKATHQMLVAQGHLPPQTVKGPGSPRALGKCDQRKPPCVGQEVCNPVTGRCVTIGKATHQRLVAQDTSHPRPPHGLGVLRR